MSKTAGWRSSPPRVANTPRRVLVAEDDEDFRDLVTHALELDGYNVEAVPDGGRLLVRIARTYADGHPYDEFDLIVSDICMPVCDGLQILEGLRKALWRTPVILMTAFADAGTRVRAEARGAVLFTKPFAASDLRATARSLI